MTISDKVGECPHCHQSLKKWKVPLDSTWTAEFFLVCFNDDCSYYKKGWENLRGKYNADASYRFHIDPTTGYSGPLPVWSSEALKGDIIEDD